MNLIKTGFFIINIVLGFNLSEAAEMPLLDNNPLQTIKRDLRVETKVRSWGLSNHKQRYMESWNSNFSKLVHILAKLENKKDTDNDNLKIWEVKEQNEKLQLIKHEISDEVIKTYCQKLDSEKLGETFKLTDEITIPNAISDVETYQIYLYFKNYLNGINEGNISRTLTKVINLALRDLSIRKFFAMREDLKVVCLSLSPHLFTQFSIFPLHLDRCAILKNDSVSVIEMKSRLRAPFILSMGEELNLLDFGFNVYDFRFLSIDQFEAIVKSISSQKPPMGAIIKRPDLTSSSDASLPIEVDQVTKNHIDRRLNEIKVKIEINCKVAESVTVPENDIGRLILKEYLKPEQSNSKSSKEDKCNIT